MSRALQALEPVTSPCRRPAGVGALSTGAPPLCPQELAQKQEEEAAQQGPVVVSPASDYKDKYSHLIGKGAAKDAAHMLQANKTYGCGEPWWELRRHEVSMVGGGEGRLRSCPLSPLLPVPVANKRDTRSIEEAMNEIRAKKRLRQSGEELPTTS